MTSVTTETTTLASSGGWPALRLHFRKGRLFSIEFLRTSDARAVLTSPVTSGRYMPIRRGKQVVALLVLLLDQAVWVARDPERARREVVEARDHGEPVPRSAPVLESERGPMVASLAEALRARRNTSILRMFGHDLLFVEDAFGHRLKSPTVWVDARVLAPQNIAVTLDGVEVTDPETLARLAMDLEAER